MYSSQAGVMQAAPRSSVGSSAKDHAVPEQTADALGYPSVLKACFRIVAETLSSIRSTDEDHKLQGVSEGKQDSATVRHSQVATHTISKDLYETAHPLPGSKTKKMVYPLAPVEIFMFTMDEYVYQFEVVQEKLKEIVDKDEVLRLRGKSIMYRLHMVGTTPQTAVPTIVVECTFEDQKRIRAAFKHHSTDNFYCYHESKRLRKSVSGSTKIPPPFCLVYRGGDGNPYERSASETQLSVSLPHHSTLCGSLVSFQGRSATLALTLEVDSEGMVLTAGHLKSTQLNPEPSVASTPGGIHNDEVTLNGDDRVEISPLWVDEDDDDEYEMEAAAFQPLPSRSLPLDYISAVYAKNRLVSQLQKMRPVDPSAELGPSEPDLDWMLLECKDYAFRARSRNFMYLPEQLEPIPLKEIANKPRMHAAPVFMISGVRGVIKGRMLGMPTFIGSGPGKKSCKAWSVVLDNQLVVLPGESGSVVVDQDTFSVYGHVVGSDRLGHALTIPLCDTIQQIMIAFNAKSVCLPQGAKPVDPEALEGHQRGHQSPRQRRSSHEQLESLTSDSPTSTLHSEVTFESKHVCAACSIPYLTAHALDQHAKEATHQAYKCNCGAGFSKHSTLKRHIDIQDASKNFTCTLCHHDFTRKDKLNDHYRHYHRVTNEDLLQQLNSQESRSRAAASFRHRDPVTMTTDSSGTLAPGLSPASAPARPSAGWTSTTTGQQDSHSYRPGAIPPLDPANTVRRV